MTHPASVRVTATLTVDQDQALREIAMRNQVSVAWLIRYAIDRFLKQNSFQLPLDLD